MGDVRGNPDKVISRNLASEAALVGLDSGKSPAVSETESFWTPERMAEATPVSNVVEELNLVDWGGSHLYLESGAVGKRDSWWPAGVNEVPLAPASIPGGFQTARVTDDSRAPHLAVGRLYMTFGALKKTATAWAVGERAIVTAGHCLYDPETAARWASRIKFVPRYRRKTEPAGSWAAVSIHVLAGWQEGGDYRYDLAAAVLDRPVQPTTGSIGWIAGQPDAGPYQSIGYPSKYLTAAHNFDGEEMWRCNGRKSAVGQMNNNMTEGSSGGPWLIRKSGKIYAVGLNSFRSVGETGKMNSPAFGRGFLNLIEAVGA